MKKIALLACALVASCADSATDNNPTPTDVPVTVDRADVVADVGIDVGRDVGFDVGRDAGSDAGFDAGFDVGDEKSTDVDAGADVVAVDVPPATPVGVYTYAAVAPGALIAPVAVAWHPSGGYALVLSASDTVFRYSPALNTVAMVASAGADVTWRGVTFTPDGAHALLLGNTLTGSNVRGRIFAWDDATSMLAERAADAWPSGRYEALRWSGDGTRGALLGSTSSTLSLWRLDASGERVGDPVAQGRGSDTRCDDVAWVVDDFGDPNIAVVCGTNTADILAVTAVSSSMPSIASVVPGSLIGSVSRIAARPQGDVALAIGSTAQRLYRYRRGIWSTGSSAPTVTGAFGVAFSTDGLRALAFGGFGRAYEYRYDLYSDAALADVGIAGLAAAPFTQPAGAVLNDVAWRPGCHEGLAVGGAAASAFVAYFRVTNGVHCGDGG